MERSIPCEVWYRNSLAANTFTPPRSDIDVSILLHDNSSKTLTKLVKRHKLLSTLCPLFHEVNTYQQDKLARTIFNSNHFEISRDPVLIRKLDQLEISLWKNDKKLQKAHFLIKMLEFDISNLNSRPQYRHKKWINHFQTLNLQPPETISIQSILNEIINLLGTHHHLPMLEKLTKQNLCYTEHERSIWFYWPIKFIIFELPNSASPKVMDPINSIEQQLCLQAIQWEVWGLASQLPFLNRKNLKQHLEHLKIFIRPYLSPKNCAIFDESLNDFQQILG